MGASVSSLDEVKSDEDFFIWVVQNVPSTYHSWVNSDYNFYEHNFKLTSIYKGVIDKEFADKVSNYIIRYLRNVTEEQPPHDKIVRLSIAFTNELMERGLIDEAVSFVEKLTEFKFYITNDKYFYEILENPKCASKVTYIIFKSKPSWFNSKSFRTDKCLSHIDNISDLITTGYSCSGLFNDKYINQFKMMFCHERNSPFYFIMTNNMHYANSQCLLWLLTTFEYSQDQIQKIFIKNGNINLDPEISKILITMGPLTQDFFINLFWEHKLWRSVIIDKQYLTREEIKAAADTPDKRNILVMEFKLVNM